MTDDVNVDSTGSPDDVCLDVVSGQQPREFATPTSPDDELGGVDRLRELDESLGDVIANELEADGEDGYADAARTDAHSIRAALKGGDA